MGTVRGVQECVCVALHTSALTLVRVSRPPSCMTPLWADGHWQTGRNRRSGLTVNCFSSSLVLQLTEGRWSPHLCVSLRFLSGPLHFPSFANWFVLFFSPFQHINIYIQPGNPDCAALWARCYRRLWCGIGTRWFTYVSMEKRCCLAVLVMIVCSRGLGLTTVASNSSPDLFTVATSIVTTIIFKLISRQKHNN